MNYAENAKSVLTQLLTESWNWEPEAVQARLQQLGARCLAPTGEESNAEIWRNTDGLRFEVLYDDPERGSQLTVVLASVEVDDLDEEAFDEADRELGESYEALVQLLEARYGPPVESGAVMGSQLMGEQYADLGTCWQLPQGVLMLLTGQQDTELPLQLMLVLRPPTV